MGNSASKATSNAKTATRHFPSAANVIQERATNATAMAAAAAAAATTTAAATTSRTTATANKISSSPKQDYLNDQKRLEEELARYDEQLKKSGKLDGESRPLEDTPSAAELQFFGNLRSIGQVKVANPDEIKHHEAEQILKRKLPAKPISSSSGTIAFAQSLPLEPSSTTSFTTPSTMSTLDPSTSSRVGLTSLKLMELLQLRNHDPSVWTMAQLSEEYGLRKEDVQTLMKYVNTYAILPGKDAKGRETGVWCEDLRGVVVLEKPSSKLTEGELVSNEKTSESSPSASSATPAKAAHNRTRSDLST
ncbi:hypothetical protein EDD11_000308 [Mortierella claussenii]|nr:hypothetical protein EDD11_000308 [Mortierella claussenii]